MQFSRMIVMAVACVVRIELLRAHFKWFRAYMNISNAFKMNEMRICRKQNKTKQIKIIGKNLKNKTKNHDCTCVRPNGWYNDDLVSRANRYFFAIHTHNLCSQFIYLFLFFSSLRLCFVYICFVSVTRPMCHIAVSLDWVNAYFFGWNIFKIIIAIWYQNDVNRVLEDRPQYTDNLIRDIKCHQI